MAIAPRTLTRVNPRRPSMSPSAEPPTMRQQRQCQVERVTDQLETPSVDNRGYRVIRLPNQLEALLVHDADTDKASAALDVNVGSFSDESDMPGMAHAVEHFVLMGTKKYPENEYSEYLSLHSGSSNAQTHACSTNYYFDVAAKPSNNKKPTRSNPSPLFGALDRFAQFFIAPLFEPTTLDRELRVMDSEDKGYKQRDDCRLSQLHKSLSNPNHPYSHLPTGNLETLKILPESKGVDVRAKLMKFYETHYSANRMMLCVLGREPLDVLEKWVAELFAEVPNKDLPKKTWEAELPWTQDRLCKQVYAKPIMNIYGLQLCFPFLQEEALFESQPGRYISYLIGHLGPGSIMSYIKVKGWANTLAAGTHQICPGTPGQFFFYVELTEKGLVHYKDIARVFFQYVALLREGPPEERIFNELKEMADWGFKFMPKTSASEFTSKICAVMQKPIPREWLLSGQYRLRKFDAKLIKQGLDLLRPDNFFMTLTSSEFPGDWDHKEKWYGAEYKIEDIPKDFISELTRIAYGNAKDRLATLHLPGKNQYIPTALEAEKQEVKQPAILLQLLRKCTIPRKLYMKDDTFRGPKANVKVCLSTPLVLASAANFVKARLFTNLVTDAVEDYAYGAGPTGLSYIVSLDSRGMFVEVSGYKDKLPVLLKAIMVTMRDLEIRDDRFEIAQERANRSFQDSELLQPYKQVSVYVRCLTLQHLYHVEELVQAASNVTADGVRRFHTEVMSQLHIKTLVHGNLAKQDARELTEMTELTLKLSVLPQEEWPIARSLIIPPGYNFLFSKTLKNPESVHHCIEYFLQIDPKGDPGIRAKTQLLGQILDEPALRQLRTKEQLGYIVFAGVCTVGSLYGYGITVESEEKPEYLSARIDLFLATQGTALKEMSEVDFESHKRSIANACHEGFGKLDGDSRDDEARVSRLTKGDMIGFYNKFIAPESPERAKLAIHLIAQGPSGNATQAHVPLEREDVPAPSNGKELVEITDIKGFKTGLKASAFVRQSWNRGVSQQADAKQD
ncbi:peptidase M16 inactive domain-containing protein [Microdochium trichocladiopsis]|uniref:Peptidase M16 inactive domain-containing protein n=1 Tax=Microdochium trichocladiopsis TaxID=1682393 RepID=A0A9P8XQR5_9PEZI|nr:peptidase M16 inactive domain-containing protein [Microdochium trichocladiopsis]KAH7012102.1 peptidase M16 inactive domain-containing protein [Microdochium trichocladiopsis]